uniref:Uncharacterized protein n=1 Tax=Oryza nivara TaxID=4536 RepID=A0A0E0HWS0_ORYNI
MGILACRRLNPRAVESTVLRSVGSGLPETTWQSASTRTLRHRTSTVGCRTPTLSILRRCFRSSLRLSRWMSATSDSLATAAASVTNDGQGHRTRHLLPLWCSLSQDIRVSLHLVPPLASSYAELHTNNNVAMGPSVPIADGIFLQLLRQCGSSLP